MFGMTLSSYDYYHVINVGRTLPEGNYVGHYQGWVENAYPQEGDVIVIIQITFSNLVV